MAFVMIPEELLTIKLSSAQFRALIQIINNTYSSGKYAGCCCLGYQNLANLCFTTKGAIISTVKQLEELGFIEIDKRERFNRSNALRLTLENGFNRCRENFEGTSGNDLKGSLNSTDERSLNSTDERSLNSTEGSLNSTLGSLNSTLGSLNSTPHIDLKFKNLDLKTKQRAHTREERYLKDTDENIAPADVAAGLSKPSQQAGENSAGNVGADVWAAKDKRMRKLLTRIYPDFTTWYALFRTPAGTYQINPVSSLIERIMPDKARINSVPDGVEVCSWAETPRLGLIKIM